MEWPRHGGCSTNRREGLRRNRYEFDGSKWARLTRGGTIELSVDVFADAGDYEIEVCAVSKVSDFDTSLSTDLGALSGFLLGRCAAPQSLTVE